VTTFIVDTLVSSDGVAAPLPGYCYVAVDGTWLHPTEPATRRLVLGCVHEHIETYYVCEPHYRTLRRCPKVCGLNGCGRPVDVAHVDDLRGVEIS
jgi:hypothetical protein